MKYMNETENTTRQDKNQDFVMACVEQASGGFLKVKRFQSGSTGGVVISRTDDMALDGESETRHPFDDQPVTGVQFGFYVPQYGRLDRRNRTTLREIHDAVRHVLCRHIATAPAYAFEGLWSFASRNHLS